MGLLYTLLIGWPLWLASSLLTYFLLTLALTVAWRAYKTYLARRVKFLHARQMKPVSSAQAVLITGATSGIGLAVAKHLYAQGYSIIGAYYDAREPGHEQLRRLGERGPSPRGSGAQKLLLVELDVRRAQDIGKAYTLVEAWLDANKLELYGLINNAGVGSLQPFAWLQRANIFRLTETNLLGCLLVTREFLPLLAKCEGGGRNLLVSSGLGLVPGATYAAYGLAKCAQIYFAKCLNLELKERYRVQTVAVIPHNFIKNTNICAANVATNESAWDELKPIERQLYKSEFDEHLARAKSLEEAMRDQRAKIEAETGGDNRNRKQVDKNKRRPVQNTGQVDGSWLSSAKQLACAIVKMSRQIVRSLKAESTALTIEESGALECFEDALRLRDPPEQIFAGDSTFQLLIGPLMLALPDSCKGLLSGTVASSMYK